MTWNLAAFIAAWIYVGGALFTFFPVYHWHRKYNAERLPDVPPMHPVGEGLFAALIWPYILIRYWNSEPR